MKVPFADLTRIPAAQQQAMEGAALRVLRHKRFILGDEVLAFERALARRLGVAHVVATSNGSDALLMALQAAGVGPGSTVVTSPFSFFATVGAILRLGARPRFVDIEPRHFGMDLGATLRAAAPGDVVLPVHLFGHCQDLTPVKEKLPESPVVEDACQAIDARTRAGALAGGQGQSGVFSFFPTKNLGAAGDAGAIATHDAAMAARLARLRIHGQKARYEHEELGGNFRMDALQAAILAAALPFLDESTRSRRSAAEGYLELIRERGLEGLVALPDIGPGHTAHQFVVRIPERRDALREAFEQAGIGSAVYYPKPLHLQAACRHLGHAAGDFPEAERASREALALPIAGVTPEEQAAVVAVMAEALS